MELVDLLGRDRALRLLMYFTALKTGVKLGQRSVMASKLWVLIGSFGYSAWRMEEACPTEQASLGHISEPTAHIRTHVL